MHQQSLPRIHRVLNDRKNNRVYLLMEYIAGDSLEILRQQQPDRRFSSSQAITIMAPVVAAVTYLHSQRPSIIHGDIKPANIITSGEGSSVVLVGIGLMKACDPGSTATADQYCFRAPEQFNGSIDVRADLYALAATFYTLLTGKLPPGAHSRLKQIGDGVSDPLEPVNSVVAGIPLHIGKAIERAMSLDAQHRFSSVEQFWYALWYLDEQSAPAYSTPIIPEGPPADTAREPGETIEQATEKTAPEPPVAGSQEDPDVVNLLPKPSGDRRIPITWRTLSMLIVTLAFLISLGFAMGFLSRARSHPAADTATPGTHAASPAFTSTSAPFMSAYPILSGTYTGTLYNVHDNVSSSISLSIAQLNQGSFSGYLGLESSSKKGNGWFRGTSDTLKHFQFTVSDATGNAALFFEGAMQSPTSLSGDYYACAPSPIQRDTCIRAPGGFGIWNVLRALSERSSPSSQSNIADASSDRLTANGPESPGHSCQG